MEKKHQPRQSLPPGGTQNRFHPRRHAAKPARKPIAQKRAAHGNQLARRAVYADGGGDKFCGVLPPALRQQRQQRFGDFVIRGLAVAHRSGAHHDYRAAGARARGGVQNPQYEHRRGAGRFCRPCDLSFSAALPLPARCTSSGWIEKSPCRSSPCRAVACLPR